MDKKTRPIYMYILSTRDSPQNKRPTETKVKGWEKIFHANGNEKESGVTILTPAKIDFKRL